MTALIAGDRVSLSLTDLAIDRRRLVSGAIIATGAVGVRPLFAQTPSPATASSLVSYVVEHGQPGAKPDLTCTPATPVSDR